MSLSEMEKKLADWRHEAGTILDLNENHLQSLASGISATVQKQSLDSPTLCAKKDIILAKFDALLHKLGAEELALNITDHTVQAQKTEALKAWLDSESDYRLTEQKSLDAKEGADYAQQQYEKYNTAYNDASKAADSLRHQNDAERQSLLDEQNLIQEIMRLVGILNDAAASTKAVGGSTKLLQVPQKLSASKVAAELKKLEALSAKIEQPKMRQQLNQLKISLDAPDESGEVATILKQMLEDISDRIRILNNLDEAAQAQSSKMQSSLIEWQTKLVDLSNAADKAKAQAQAQNLQRQTLAGAKKQAEATAIEERAAYKLTLPPYLKEIFVIQTIKEKITQACA